MWPGGSGSPGSTTSLPVDRIATRGLREHLDVGAADRRERADAARRQHVARGDDAIAGGDVGAAAADVLARDVAAAKIVDRRSPPFAVSSTITTASAPAGQRRAGRDFGAGAARRRSTADSWPV